MADKFRICTEASPTPRVLILGCGFAGLWAAQALHKAPVEVTVLDRTNHHLFTPLLYQVATAALSAPSIAGPTLLERGCFTWLDRAPQRRDRPGPRARRGRRR
jgi:2-polyprenyl-6-methoxyphenol hydroxylase-like FAD-dependent oxidoreductase